MPDRDQEIRLRAVFDTAVDGTIEIDARGRVLMFNPACEKLFEPCRGGSGTERQDVDAVSPSEARMPYAGLPLHRRAAR